MKQAYPAWLHACAPPCPARAALPDTRCTAPHRTALNRTAGGFSSNFRPTGSGLPTSKSVTLTYRIYIDPEMQWVEGGKMGFGFLVNGISASGGSRKDTASSMRVTFSKTGDPR